MVAKLKKSSECPKLMSPILLLTKFPYLENFIDNNCEMVHKIDFMFLGHESLAAIMTSRLKNLSVVARYWGDGDIKVSTSYTNFM